MSKHIFMIPIPANDTTLFIHEMDPDGAHVVYSRIKNGVLDVDREKVESSVSEDGRRFDFATHYLDVAWAAKVNAALNGEIISNKINLKDYIS